MKVYIDSRVEYRYSSFYRLGIYRLIGKKNVVYSASKFQDLPNETSSQFGCGLQIICEKNGVEKKIYFDIKDIAEVEQDKYEWADIYAKVNVKAGDLERYPKLVVSGPQCGLRNRSLLSLILFGLCNYIKSFSSSKVSYKLYLQTYLYPYARRRPLSAYESNREVKSNYIFHASTLWYNEFAATDTNKYRGEFLKACQRAGLEIEGGLFYVGGEAVLKEMPDYPKYKEEYKDFIYDKRLSMDDYIMKTKESVVVFNTPSVCGCHGWKLAEYLCMGKAIISTPLSREMPAPMEHGKHIHFVHSVDEIYDAVVKINTDEAYRKQLEEGARAYYEQWLAPEVVVKRIIKLAFKGA